MIQAIGASAGAAYGGAPESLTALQGLLQRHKQQLSDCVNCASAGTPRGKADIEAINVRISQVRERIVKAESAQSTTATQATAVQEARSTEPLAGAGARIDVFA